MSDQDRGQGRTGSGKPAGQTDQRGNKSPGRGSRTSSQYSEVDAPAAQSAPSAAAPPASPPAEGGGGASAGPDDGGESEALGAFDAAFDLAGVAAVGKPRIDRDEDEVDESPGDKPAPGAKHELEPVPETAPDEEPEPEPDGAE
ncbi:MAG: hypothetical protein KJO07_18945 [Deltaproteobacteria bacterium]|nr:hypothetical protein [Deltaproteobacteria bacterium]